MVFLSGRALPVATAAPAAAARRRRERQGADEEKGNCMLLKSDFFSRRLSVTLCVCNQLTLIFLKKNGAMVLSTLDAQESRRKENTDSNHNPFSRLRGWSICWKHMCR